MTPKSDMMQLNEQKVPADEFFSQYFHVSEAKKTSKKCRNKRKQSKSSIQKMASLKNLQKIAERKDSSPIISSSIDVRNQKSSSESKLITKDKGLAVPDLNFLPGKKVFQTSRIFTPKPEAQNQRSSRDSQVHSRWAKILHTQRGLLGSKTHRGSYTGVCMLQLPSACQSKFQTWPCCIFSLRQAGNKEKMLNRQNNFRDECVWAYYLGWPNYRNRFATGYEAYFNESYAEPLKPLAADNEFCVSEDKIFKSKKGHCWMKGLVTAFALDEFARWANLGSTDCPSQTFSEINPIHSKVVEYPQAVVDILLDDTLLSFFNEESNDILQDCFCGLVQNVVVFLKQRFSQSYSFRVTRQRFSNLLDGCIDDTDDDLADTESDFSDFESSDERPLVLAPRRRQTNPLETLAKLKIDDSRAPKNDTNTVQRSRPVQQVVKNNADKEQQPRPSKEAVENETKMEQLSRPVKDVLKNDANRDQQGKFTRKIVKNNSNKEEQPKPVQEVVKKETAMKQQSRPVEGAVKNDPKIDEQSKSTQEVVKSATKIANHSRPAKAVLKSDAKTGHNSRPMQEGLVTEEEKASDEQAGSPSKKPLRDTKAQDSKKILSRSDIPKERQAEWDDLSIILKDQIRAQRQGEPDSHNFCTACAAGLRHWNCDRQLPMCNICVEKNFTCRYRRFKHLYDASVAKKQEKSTPKPPSTKLGLDSALAIEDQELRISEENEKEQSFAITITPRRSLRRNLPKKTETDGKRKKTFEVENLASTLRRSSRHLQSKSVKLNHAIKREQKGAQPQIKSRNSSKLALEKPKLKKCKAGFKIGDQVYVRNSLGWTCLPSSIIKVREDGHYDVQFKHQQMKGLPEEYLMPVQKTIVKVPQLNAPAKSEIKSSTQLQTLRKVPAKGPGIKLAHRASLVVSPKSPVIPRMLLGLQTDLVQAQPGTSGKTRFNARIQSKNMSLRNRVVPHGKLQRKHGSRDGGIKKNENEEKNEPGQTYHLSQEETKSAQQNDNPKSFFSPVGLVQIGYCHVCQIKKPKVYFNCRNGNITHSYCENHLKLLFDHSFAAVLNQPTLIPACPVCEDKSCRCFRCMRGHYLEEFNKNQGTEDSDTALFPKSEWTKDECKILIQGLPKFGRNYAAHARKIKGKTVRQVKAFFQTHYFSKRKGLRPDQKWSATDSVIFETFILAKLKDIINDVDSSKGVQLGSPVTSSPILEKEKFGIKQIKQPTNNRSTSGSPHRKLFGHKNSRVRSSTEIARQGHNTDTGDEMSSVINQNLMLASMQTRSMKRPRPAVATNGGAALDPLRIQDQNSSGMQAIRTVHSKTDHDLKNFKKRRLKGDTGNSLNHKARNLIKQSSVCNRGRHRSRIKPNTRTVLDNNPTLHSKNGKVVLGVTRIRRRFEGFGWFEGTIIKYEEPFYLVLYDDGDEQEFTPELLEPLIIKEKCSFEDCDQQARFQFSRISDRLYCAGHAALKWHSGMIDINKDLNENMQMQSAAVSLGFQKIQHKMNIRQNTCDHIL